MLVFPGVPWIDKIKALHWIEQGLAFLGRLSLPIMFMHIPLNTWREHLKYGRIVYTLIGIRTPVLFTLLFHRYKIMRTLFGLPNLSNR